MKDSRVSFLFIKNGIPEGTNFSLSVLIAVILVSLHQFQNYCLRFLIGHKRHEQKEEKEEEEEDFFIMEKYIFPFGILFIIFLPTAGNFVYFCF